jgi:hypothetical protein
MACVACVLFDDFLSLLDDFLPLAVLPVVFVGGCVLFDVVLCTTVLSTSSDGDCICIDGMITLSVWLASVCM